MAWRRQLPGVVLIVVGLALLALPRVADNYVLYVMTRLFVYVLVALGLNLLTGYAGQVSLGHAAFFAIGAYTAAVLAERLQWPSIVCVVVAALIAHVSEKIRLTLTPMRRAAVWLWAVARMAMPVFVSLKKR